MGVLHHVSMSADDQSAWALFLDTLGDGDTVVLLDQAARSLQLAGARIRGRSEVRWLLPSAERGADGPPPAGIDEVADSDWWLLIAAHPALLEWS